MSYRGGIVAWINFFSVIPLACSGNQLKILKLLVLKVVFLNTVDKLRDDFDDPSNKAFN